MKGDIRALPHSLSFVNDSSRTDSQRMSRATKSLKSVGKNNSGDYKPNNDINQFTLESRNSQQWYYWQFWLQLCWGVGVFSVLSLVTRHQYPELQVVTIKNIFIYLFPNVPTEQNCPKWRTMTLEALAKVHEFTVSRTESWLYLNQEIIHLWASVEISSKTLSYILFLSHSHTFLGRTYQEMILYVFFPRTLRYWGKSEVQTTVFLLRFPNKKILGQAKWLQNAYLGGGRKL